MKNKTWIPAFAGMTLLIAGAVHAADYYIYKDSAGRLIVGNQMPPAGARIVKHYDWVDATDAEIAAAARENRAVEARLMERDRIAAQDKLGNAIIEANALAAEKKNTETKALSVEVLNFGFPISKLFSQRSSLNSHRGVRR